METSKIINTTIPIKPKIAPSLVGSFKAVLAEKKDALKSTPRDLAPRTLNTPSSSITDVVNHMVDNHEMAIKSVRTFMTRTDYSPEKLLAIQYKTGILFLREQMFSKTAELSANTVKNFTQMQV
jgi:hypothetical protein